jgi:hypothetical protein
VPEHPQRARRVLGAAADRRGRVRDDVTREMSDDAERPHGREA